MYIRTVLSISHALVVGIFIIAFLTIFFSLTRPPGPPPTLRTGKILSEVLESDVQGAALIEKLNKLGHKNTASLDIFDRQGNHTRLAGPPTQIEAPVFMDAILSGHTYEDRETEKIHIFWIPVDLTSEHSHVVRWEIHRTRDLFFSEVRRNIGIACGVAFLAVLAIAFILSRTLAAPIRELASLVDRFGREGYRLRSNSSGTSEVRELSRSFNRMAEFIESNTNELKSQKEQAERTESLRRQFLSDVSHNLRTPLTAIMGWNDALIEGVAEDETLYRQRIRREVQHVTRTVGRLLELSRWERAAPMLLLENIHLSELLLEVAENLQDVAEQSGVTLSFEGMNSDITIHADRQKARDVLQILLENVVEHAGRDVHATVRVEVVSERVRFVIEDNGVGLPDTFDQTDIERGASEVGRACLGLAIASRLVVAHGGELKMENRAEGGTHACFSFALGEKERDAESDV